MRFDISTGIFGIKSNKGGLCAMSEYKDKKGNTYTITNTVLLPPEEKERIENEIVEELYRIFTQK